MTKKKVMRIFNETATPESNEWDTFGREVVQAVCLMAILIGLAGIGGIVWEYVDRYRERRRARRIMGDCSD